MPSESRSETVPRRAGCGKSARPDPWGARPGNWPGLPDCRPPEKVPPIRRLLSTTHTSPYRECSLPQNGTAGRTSSLTGCAPAVSLCFGCGIRTSHPSGSRRGKGGPSPAPFPRPWHVLCAPRESSVPGRVQVVWTTVKAASRRRCQHHGARDLGASPQQSQKRWETGANHP